MIMWGLSQVCKADSKLRNQYNPLHRQAKEEKNPVIILIDEGKLFDKIKHSFMIKKKKLSTN